MQEVEQKRGGQQRYEPAALPNVPDASCENEIKIYREEQLQAMAEIKKDKRGIDTFQHKIEVEKVFETRTEEDHGELCLLDLLKQDGDQKQNIHEFCLSSL